MNEVNVGQTLSTDINVITAEINAYQRVAGEAIFEIGRRLHEVKYNPRKFDLPVGTDKEGREIVARGAWGEFLSSINTSIDSAKWFIAVFIELGGETNRWLTTNKGVDFLYRIATMPKEQRDQPHTILSTGEVKTVDEI
ncbi:DNA modification methylase [Lysinibacillus irui]|uniref:DNA modification methylase n=1 Tax=Lysinibacillus irui TaxID=2998077 RepID=A0ABU5NKE1_9BACI|nr:DNA modification methylase [Lysinibacillus irui]MEA0554764.1 DNA modification methylase [Lysinibacillus irui]MEA0976479.1 DNA modification methylase [Lysinibacillus irui]MEA1042633.1 DNA modification methylase [Lysinibacillus irui]